MPWARLRLFKTCRHHPARNRTTSHDIAVLHLQPARHPLATEPNHSRICKIFKICRMKSQSETGRRVTVVRLLIFWHGCQSPVFSGASPPPRAATKGDACGCGTSVVAAVLQGGAKNRQNSPEAANIRPFFLQGEASSRTALPPHRQQGTCYAYQNERKVAC